eukprot:GFUD01114611.1.p1 GENE.GFUD01114611.1~~GFUD01114611.1.p1  ORF type:complete len:474 (+),score=150.41 GFUD01114611.1:96-1517(+)
MADTVSYKVKYQHGEESEVRRFGIDKDVSSSFTYLENKLQHVFPQLRRQSFSIQWNDDEGDIVTVGNDEDLMIALTEMKEVLYKFVVKKVNKGHCGNKSVNNGSIHTGVKCDGCQGDVVGFRYKCLICEDFDLCGDCEGFGHHSEHDMIRISNPQVIWPQHVFSPLRIINPKKETSKEEEIKKKKPEASKCQHGKMIPPSIETLLGPTFEMMVKALTGQQRGNQETKEKSERTNAEKENNKGNNCSEKAMENPFEKLTESIIGNSKNVESIGKMVSDLLEPLGVNVSVQMKPKNDSTKDQKVETEKAIAEPEKEKAKTEKEKAQPEKETMELHGKRVESENLSGYLSPPLSDDGDWNVIENNKPEIKEKDEELPNVLYGSVNGTLYPTLPEILIPDAKIPEEIASIPSTSSASNASTPTPSVIAQHSDPKVRVALQAMLNMGFTNDGGWLTNLLEAKQGDIGKTLDVLQPNRN